MERLLNLETLSEATKKKIRDAVGVKNINQLIKLAKLSGVDIGIRKDKQMRETYKYFGQIENDLIVQRNKLKKETKKKVAIKLYTFDKLNADLAKNKLFKNYGDNKPFKITLKSALVKDIKKEFKFKNTYHFQSWLQNVESGEVMCDSANSWNQSDIDGGKNVFGAFTMTVSAIQGGRDNTRSMDRTFKTNYFTYNVFDPKSQNNNCGIKVIESILGIKLDSTKCRQELNIKSGVMLTEENLIQLYKSKGGKKLTIISDDFDGDVDGDTIYFHNEHYYHVKEAIRHKLKDKKTKRGNLYWDIEIRKSLKDIVMIGKTESYMLKPTLLSMVYTNYKDVIIQVKTFISNRDKTCVEQFKDWLSQQSSKGKCYNCFAHNGSRFDHYLLMNTFNEHDILDSELQLRGTSIIGLQYKSHLFKDSCCFLVNSLANLCNGYCVTEEEKQYSKLKNFMLHGKEVSNTQLCFYRPELDYDEFLELQHTDKEFWELYVKYCEYDCYSLRIVWEKFVEQCNKAIGKMGSWVLRYANASSCNTIGSLSKKLIDTLNNVGKGQKPNKNMKEYLEFIDNDFEKYEFIKKFKRGGISHCNQAGKHTEGIMGVDIKSQYPTAMMKMEIPIGKSRWITEESDGYGFYELKNVVFKDSSFKPVAKSIFGQSLNWACDKIDTLFVDTFMLEYIKKNSGLVSYEFVKGLVSDKFVDGSTFFRSYVDVLYKEKEQEDLYKDTKDARYNKPYREVVKLLLNSVTGKMNEDPSRYFRIRYEGDDLTKHYNDNIDIFEAKYGVQKKAKMNGVEFSKDTVETKFKINQWITAGVMIYSYSKRLLFEYINLLPNKSNDVIHVETDGIYFGLPHKEKFMENLSKYDGDFKEVKLGDKLGNIDVEVEKEGVSYWLGKKFYYIYTNYKKDGSIDYANSKIKIKGIPTTTIDDYGTNVDLVNEKFYEDIYAGKLVVTEFSAITRFLFDSKRSDTIGLSSYKMKRTTKGQMKYGEY